MMAASMAPEIPAPVLSQKQRRAILRKERRKRKRQALAKARESDLQNGAPPLEEEEMNDGDDDDNEVADVERLRLHEEWLERERLAQEVFRLQVEREEATRRRKEEEERMIKEEWEARQRKEQEEKEQRQQEKRVRELKEKTSHNSFISHNMDEAVQKMLDEAENQLDKEGPWMNPEAPATVNSENYGTERDVANCPFFLKTGACRFGDRCSRKHNYPTSSPTLMVRSMFTTFGMEQSRRDDYDIDACLEHSEEELQESFVDFYHDVLPEFRNVGKVVQFKVSCNYEPHLRGNVYIQFDTEEHCRDAFIKFNGRWYAGRQLHCEICPVTRWKNAICGLFDRQKCSKGKHCNFLHVFRNPGNEFWEADRDLHLSPNRSVRSSRRDGWHSERYGDRSWRQRRYSRSPERRESRRGGDRRRSRSRSRERRSSHQHAEDRRSSRSERSDRRKDLSRDRSRSRSRDRDRLRDRSRDKDRESRSEERNSRHKDEGIHREAKDKSRSKSRERKRKLSKDRSPKKSSNGKIPGDDTDTRRRHKHSKKSKKKSKKKHKKKSHLPPEETASSGESEQEKDSEDETADSHSVPIPCKEENEIEQKPGDVDQRVHNEENPVSEIKCEQTNPDLTGNGDGGCSSSPISKSPNT